MFGSRTANFNKMYVTYFIYQCGDMRGYKEFILISPGIRLHCHAVYSVCVCLEISPSLTGCQHCNNGSLVESESDTCIQKYSENTQVVYEAAAKKYFLAHHSSA